MLNDSLHAAQDVTEILHEAEAAMDNTIDSVARCVSRMVRARQRARLPLAKGQDALEQMIGSLTALSTARREMIGSHAAMRDVSDELGVPPMAFGDLCPVAQAAPIDDQRTRHLQVVA